MNQNPTTTPPFSPARFGEFVLGKTVVAVRLPAAAERLTGFELVFADGSELSVIAHQFEGKSELMFTDLYPGEGRGLDPEDNEMAAQEGWQVLLQPEYAPPGN
jgi:hypothetical protein